VKLEDLLKAYRECDPMDCDCESCPLSGRVELTAGDTIDVSFSICSVLQEIEDWAKERDAHE